jgi:probable F420-dependent oxidoreductase
MSKITIGVTLHPQHTTTAELLDAFQRADALGVDTIWTWDHFFPLTGDLNGSSFEAWTILAACGVQTTRAQIGCLVHGIGYRNPALLSAMAKTLDHFLGGRLILGLGAGWHDRDYQEYGYEFGTPGSRLRDLERGIEIINDRWQVDVPKPPRGRVPIMIGGGGEKVTLRITAQHADIWHSFGSPTSWGAKNANLDEWCARVGRDPRAIGRSVSISDDRREPASALLAELDTRADAYIAAGATDFVYGLSAPYDLSPVEALLEWRGRRG